MNLDKLSREQLEQEARAAGVIAPERLGRAALERRILEHRSHPLRRARRAFRSLVDIAKTIAGAPPALPRTSSWQGAPKSTAVPTTQEPVAPKTGASKAIEPSANEESAHANAAQSSKAGAASADDRSKSAPTDTVAERASRDTTEATADRARPETTDTAAEHGPREPADEATADRARPETTDTAADRAPRETAGTDAKRAPLETADPATGDEAQQEVDRDARGVDGSVRAALPPASDAIASEPIPTRTMARLLAEQGHARRAKAIYRKLLSENPDDEDLRQEVDRLARSRSRTTAAEEDDEDAGPEVVAIAAGGKRLLVAWALDSPALQDAAALFEHPEQVLRELSQHVEARVVVVRADTRSGTVHREVRQRSAQPCGEWVLPVEPGARAVAAVGLTYEGRFVSVAHARPVIAR